MLAQELDPDVHQFNRVQSAAPLLRVPGRVGRDAVKLIQDLNAGVVGAGHGLVSIAGMPGQGSVQLLPETFPCHKGLSRAPLFPGAAVIDDGARAAGFFQPGLDRGRSSERAGPQQVVAAAVAAAALGDGLRGNGTGLLAETGEGVKLAEDADDGPAAAVRAAESRPDAAEILGDGEAQLAQGTAIEVPGLELLQREFGILPDAVGDALEQSGPLVDEGEGGFLLCQIHITAPWRGSPADVRSAGG